MKRAGKIFGVVFGALLSLYVVFPPAFSYAALGAVNALMSLGMAPELANYITGKMVNVDGSGNLILPVATGKKLSITVGGTEYTRVNSNGMTAFTSAAFENVAAGTSVQGDGPLSTSANFHAVSGFDETKVVTLPACATANIGEVHYILNQVANKFAKIFPASGGQINSLGANNAFSAGATTQGGHTVVCVCQAANQWYCG